MGSVRLELQESMSESKSASVEFCFRMKWRQHTHNHKTDLIKGGGGLGEQTHTDTLLKTFWNTTEWLHSIWALNLIRSAQFSPFTAQNMPFCCLVHKCLDAATAYINYCRIGSALWNVVLGSGVHDRSHDGKNESSTVYGWYMQVTALRYLHIKIMKQCKNTELDASQSQLQCGSNCY